MSFQMFLEPLENNLNFDYIGFSLIGMYINFIVAKNLLESREFMNRFYAILASLIIPAFHLYVFHFDKIPFVGISIINNIPLHCTSIYLAYISALPFIIADRITPINKY